MEQDVVLRTDAHRLPDRLHVVADVLAVDLGRSGRRLQQARENGTEHPIQV